MSILLYNGISWSVKWGSFLACTIWTLVAIISSLLSSQYVSLAKMAPSGRHHGVRLTTELEVVLFLIVFHLVSLEDGETILWVVTELALGDSRVAILHFTNLKVSCDLVQGVVHSVLAVDAERLCLFRDEGVLVLWFKCLAPSFRMAPVTSFKIVSHILVNNYSFDGPTLVSKVLIVTSIEMVGHLSNLEVRLSHLHFLKLQKRSVVLLDIIARELFMWKTFVFLWLLFINRSPNQYAGKQNLICTYLSACSRSQNYLSWRSEQFEVSHLCPSCLD